MSDGHPNADCADTSMSEADKGVADMSTDAGNRAMHAAGAAYKKVEDAASYVGNRADDATSAVGGRLKSMGDSVRTNTPRTGMAGSASDAIAETLENTGHYLQAQGLSGAAEDLTNIVRRNPIPALLAAVGVGFLIAQATNRPR